MQWGTRSRVLLERMWTLLGLFPSGKIRRRFDERDFEKFDADYEENDILVTDWINENFDLNTETYNADFLLSQVCRALSAAAEESVR